MSKESFVPQELIISNEKHRHLALDHSTALTDYHELMALIDAARESGLICFHQVLSSCIDKSHIRLAVHSMMSILKADMRSFIILHVLPAALHCVPRALNDIFFPRRIYVSVVELDTLARRSSSEEVLTLLSSAKVTKYPYYYSHITDYIRFAIALWEVKSCPKVSYIGLYFGHIPRFDYCTLGG